MQHIIKLPNGADLAVTIREFPNKVQIVMETRPPDAALTDVDIENFVVPLLEPYRSDKRPVTLAGKCGVALLTEDTWHQWTLRPRQNPESGQN